MKTTTRPSTSLIMQPFWTPFVCLLSGLFTLQPASAVTLSPIADSRSETSGTRPVASSTADLGVGPISTNRSFRTYMTFDLSGLTTNDTAVTATLSLFNAGSEANTSALPQVYTLFQAASDWDNATAPGPEGTALATVEITPAVGNDAQNIQFSSTNLANAFNSAIGSKLYLGIKTDKENVANRSFTFFQSMEDPNPPVLVSSTTILPMITVSVTDDSMSEPGPDTATFNLNRSEETNNVVTVFYTFKGTATQGSDYTESGSGSVTFAPGVITTNVVVSVVNDAEAESLETIVFTITSDAAYNGGFATGTATIIDDNDDNNNVLVRYIFTRGASTFSRDAQVYSTNLAATAIDDALGITVGNSTYAVSPPNAGFIASSVTSSNKTEAIANNDNFSFTLTPATGSSLTLTNLELSARYYIQNTLANEAFIFVRSSMDNFASDVGSKTFSFLDLYSTMSVPLGASFTQITSNITFRVYVFDDTTDATDGIRLDNIFVRGNLTTVARPVTSAISVGGSAPGSSVTIDFTAGASDVPGDFTLEKAATADGVYGADGGAVISANPSAPNFRATTTTTSSSQEFYRIRR